MGDSERERDSLGRERAVRSPKNRERGESERVKNGEGRWGEERRKRERRVASGRVWGIDAFRERERRDRLTETEREKRGTGHLMQRERDFFL
jgi:hypothetical protein